jgi:hypothetical protein
VRQDLAATASGINFPERLETNLHCMLFEALRCDGVWTCRWMLVFLKNIIFCDRLEEIHCGTGQLDV